ncbi:MAG: TAXI family TRAP transporter solute-binding subunit [Methyloligellaceae bacterium]
MFSTAYGQGFQLQTADGKDHTHSNTTGGWRTFALPENKSQAGKRQLTEQKGNDKASADKTPPAEKNVTAPKKKVKKAAKPSNVVRIISSTIDNSALVMANDLARLLDDGKKLRIVPIIGKGTAQSLKDIYYLKGVDIGIIQTDVLHYYKANRKLPEPNKFIRYIATLGAQEVHVVARKNIKSFKELQGRNVNIGPLEGGNAITAQAVLKAHQIEINSVHMENRAALARLKTGAIDAVVIVGGKPVVNLLNVLATSNEFHLLDINFNETLSKRYNPTVMIHEDYPFLISKDKVVSSVSVDMVMAMYYWPKGTARYAKVERFVKAFFSNLSNLQTPLYHNKWGEVRIEHDLAGWKRFQAAKDWLNQDKKKKLSSLPKR